MIRRILTALIWLCIALIGLVIFLALIPFILVAFLIAFILGLFGKSTFRVWTVKARQTASTVSQKAKAIGKPKTKPTGKVVEADVKDVEK